MNKKILVVDNDRFMLELMTNVLEKEGHEVLTAKDGISALDILGTYVPDVMFIDLIMPNIGGKTLCRIIRKMPEFKNLYVIILSAIAAEEEGDFTEIGADLCIAKGPLEEMARHVLYAMDQSDQKTSPHLPRAALGQESLRSREITRELLSVKRHFEVVLEGMSEGILEITPEAKIVYANPAAFSLAGIPEEELLGSNFIDLFSSPDRLKMEDLLDRGLSGEQTIPLDSPVTLNDRQVSLHFQPLKDNENKAVVILNDVTDQKRMEAQLLQSQKMEAAGSLAGGIAHDFNNLLMAIQGNVSLTLFGMNPSHPNYERLKSIEKQVQSGSKLTAQLLGYARKGKYEVRPIDLNRLVKEIAYTFGRARKEITIHRGLAEDLFPIVADQGQMEQTLLNLFVNAADAMPSGGSLFLKTRNTTHEEMKGRLYAPKPGNYILLTIRDTGTGMDNETKERIFEPFFTTKEMGRGTGLGLASVYGIVKGHGGYIDIDSEKGAGTTFSIYLPATEAEVGAHTAEKEERGEISRGSETLLLIDDEQTIIDVGTKMMEVLGYQVYVAKSGKEAIDVYKANRDRIDMVILDMIMPDMGGGETYDRLKEINPDIKVLLSSGYSINGQANEILERGCDGFIQKPFNMKDLSRKLREILDRRKG
ncbi:MAG: response regulator [Deltaproteobacteria bacterium]|nr:response regulator [Deltaproteobacteria bacterium]MBW1736318.1 response regulator [Deltaproteobacteria bacterium]MBW1908998.1 response regulator [Deltaproteobacteria bacterium]MBW2033093.1 response regulator [Deltaproteobacteria bacterium]MBW2113740.1 response regulator [Deltaproteobacteria bacterium]